MSDLDSQNSNDPHIRELFADMWVSVCETAARRYVSLELRSGLQPFHCDIQASRRGLKRCEDLARVFGLPLKITPEAKQWMQWDHVQGNETGPSSADSSGSVDRTSLSQSVRRLRALARRAPAELAVLDSVANELMRQSFALEDAADMLHECAGECADCGSHGTLLSGATCEACAPIREAERLARVACTPVMDLDMDARLWEALKAAVLRSPRMQPLFEDGAWLELGIQHVLTWLGTHSRTHAPGAPDPGSRTPEVESVPARRRQGAELGAQQATLIKQLASAMAQLREAGLVAEAQAHARVLREAGIEVVEGDGIGEEERGPSP